MKSNWFVFWLACLLLHTIKLCNGLNSICNQTHGDIAKCRLCKGADHTSCFQNGVYDRFFSCRHRLADINTDCNLGDNETQIFNYVSIFPPDEKKRWCYFDIVYEGSLVRQTSRLYIGKDMACTHESSKWGIKAKPGDPEHYDIISQNASGKLKLPTHIYI